MPLTPQIFFLLKKSASFPDFISEKIISIDKTLAFLQAFEHVISMFTTAQSGIWVGLLVTSLQEPSWNTRDFWLSLEGRQTFLGYLWFIFYRNRTRFLRKRTVSSSITIWSLRLRWIFLFPFRSAGRQRRLSRCNFCQGQDQQFLPVHLGYKGTSNGSRVNLQLLKSYKDANGHEKSVSWL